MKIRLTIEVSDDERDAIGAQTGTGRATRADVANWVAKQAYATLAELVVEHERAKDRTR